MIDILNRKVEIQYLDSIEVVYNNQVLNDGLSLKDY